VDLDEVWVNEGDQILLCSDGLTRRASDAQIAPVLAEPFTAQQACERLVELANELGGEDNVSVILVRLLPSPPPSWWKRALRSIVGGNRVWLN
jgi:protein phosphatase